MRYLGRHPVMGRVWYADRMGFAHQKPIILRFLGRQQFYPEALFPDDLAALVETDTRFTVGIHDPLN